MPAKKSRQRMTVAHSRGTAGAEGNARSASGYSPPMNTAASPQATGTHRSPGGNTSGGAAGGGSVPRSAAVAASTVITGPATSEMWCSRCRNLCTRALAIHTTGVIAALART